MQRLLRKARERMFLSGYLVLSKTTLVNLTYLILLLGNDTNSVCNPLKRHACSNRRKVQTVVKASSRVDKFSKSDIIVSPSILSANFSKLGEQVHYSISVTVKQPSKAVIGLTSYYHSSNL